MSVVITILLVLLAVLGGLLALLLVMPLSVVAEGEIDGLGGAFEARVRWAFGLLGFDWRLGRGAAFRVLGVPVWRGRLTGGEREQKRRLRRRRKPRAEEKARRRRGPGWAWRNRQVLRRAVLRLVGTLHVRGRASGVVGLPEPDQTAWLDVALRQLEARLPEGTLDVEVDYADEILEVHGRLGAWIVPLHALVVVLAVVLSPSVRRALRAHQPNVPAPRGQGGE